MLTRVLENLSINPVVSPNVVLLLLLRPVKLSPVNLNVKIVCALVWKKTSASQLFDSLVFGCVICRPTRLVLRLVLTNLCLVCLTVLYSTVLETPLPWVNSRNSPSPKISIAVLLHTIYSVIS